MKQGEVTSGEACMSRQWLISRKERVAQPCIFFLRFFRTHPSKTMESPGTCPPDVIFGGVTAIDARVRLGGWTWVFEDMGEILGCIYGKFVKGIQMWVRSCPAWIHGTGLQVARTD